MIKQLPTFPAPPRYYTEELAKDVVAQFKFDRSGTANENSSGNDLVLANGAKITAGTVVTDNIDDTYSFPCPYFGEGDFTIEAKITFLEWSKSDGNYIFGQYFSTATENDSWNIRLRNTPTNKTFYMILSQPGKVVSTPNVGPYNLVLNKEYHLVAERVDGVISLYVNGSLYTTYEYAQPLHIPADSNLVTSEARSNGYGRCARRIRDIRIAKRAMYRGKIYQNIREFLPSEVLPWNQFTFLNNALEDEVTGHPMVLSGSANIADSRLNTTTSYGSKAEFPSFFPEENEDFTIELKFNCVSTGNQGAILLGVWNNGAFSGNSWNISIRPDDTVAFNIPIVDAPNSSIVTSSTVKIIRNEDHHIALVRKSGVITLYLDGKAVASRVQPNAFLKQDRLVSTSWVESNGWMNGARWDIRLIRMAMYTGEFTPEPLKPFYRPTYTEQEAEGILNQYTFRENLNLDEVTGSVVTLVGGAKIEQGRLKTTNSYLSTYSMPIGYFGAGDFTLECRFNIKSQTGQATPLMSHWHSGSGVHDDNRWIININSNFTITVSIFNSRTAEDRSIRTSEATVVLGFDHHLVMERVSDIVYVYLDGVQIMSWSQPAPMWAKEGNLIRSWVGTQPTYGYGEREIWNIRVASKALYKGKIKPTSFLPRVPKSFAVRTQTVAVQALERQEPLKVTSDHNVQNATVQTLIPDTESKKITSDHNVQTVVVQTLVKI